MKKVLYDKMQVLVCDSNVEAGAAAADDLAKLLRTTIAERGEAAIILATGNSQLSFVNALRAKPDISWDKVIVFHMDEYLGMSEEHPASFRRYIREHLTDHIHPRVFYGIAGDALDVECEMARYAILLEQHVPDACVLGIGENGHLAFNDPPADFATNKLIHVIELAETSRRQQVGEGHFTSLDEVPKRAITLTIPSLLKPAHVLAVVPEARKAQAVQQALEGPVTPNCPASILRTLPRARLYLDPESASMLKV